MTSGVSRESFGTRIWRKTLAGVGVKFGFAWIGVLVFAAVFAPFLANSMPILMSKNGVISAPVLKYLSVEDVWVLANFFWVLVVYQLRIAVGKRVLLFLLGSVLIAVLANLFIKPPALVIYDDFRTAAFKEVDWRIMPPIPYAPTDYLRDMVSKGLEAPFETQGHTHLMGTEENGADVLSRMLHACRIALSIGLIASGIALFIGVIVGGLMGYFSGIVDMLGMRLVEIFEDIPTLFLLLT
ncbi:MAG: hypothetical protein U1E13_09565, partial [Methylophilaceae bacterium]|nr:hypothetical protein [Methylophilaceae bacterium]